MADLEVTASTLPDSDSFLPRYLIVQLLDILARTPEANHPETDMQLTEHAKEFIETFKSPLLFTPLTFSIFWRDNIAQVLAANPDLLNEVDQYSRAPLTIAIANEDFVLAAELVKQGSSVMLEDKLVLEIALTSMIQSKENIIEKILATAGEDVDWLSEYLSYLQGYVNGRTDESQNNKFHEVLNPPLRSFGQVLDTLSYFNGLPSHFGFLSPSIDNLSQHLQKYVQELLDATTAALFTKIANAYAFTANACKYHGNLTTAADCQTVLAAQINDNINNNSYEPVVVFGGWAGNSVAIAFINKFLIFSNLGLGGNPEAGTKIYEINNPEAITPDLIASFMNGLGLATSPNTILAQLSDMVAIEHIYTIAQDLNPVDNCIFVNPRAIVEGILLVLSTYNTSKVIQFDTLDAQRKYVNPLYRSYINSLHEHFITDLARFMRNHEFLKNKRIECCSLALDYINQHYEDPDAVIRCIELKNALEFVGLKNFYVNNISPEAKDTILNAIIQQQEATALQVIEQEYAINVAQNGNSNI